MTRSKCHLLNGIEDDVVVKKLINIEYQNSFQS